MIKKKKKKRPTDQPYLAGLSVPKTVPPWPKLYDVDKIL